MEKGNLSNWTLKTKVMDDKSEAKNNPVKQDVWQFSDLIDCYPVKQELPVLNGGPSFRTRPRKQSNPLRSIRYGPSEVIERKPLKLDGGEKKLQE